jgi:hypothetical protein
MIKGLETKIMTKKRFSNAVEELVVTKKLTYLDAITYIVEERSMDYENVKKLLTESLHVKLEAEVTKARLITTEQGNILPI